MSSAWDLQESCQDDMSAGLGMLFLNWMTEVNSEEHWRQLLQLCSVIFCTILEV